MDDIMIEIDGVPRPRFNSNGQRIHPNSICDSIPVNQKVNTSVKQMLLADQYCGLAQFALSDAAPDPEAEV